MKCPNCAEEIADDAKICEWCHSVVDSDQQVVLSAPQTSGKATASLILGIFFFLFPAAVLAIVFGHLSRREIKRSGGRLTGAGRALAGLILGYTGAAALPIILIVAAIAIPNLLRSRMAANQASAVGSLRVISTAAVTYEAIHGKYPLDLPALGPSGGAALIDRTLASGTKLGYIFTYRITQTDKSGRPISFAVLADPTTPGTTGQDHYFVDTTGVIRYETDGPANSDSRPIESPAPSVQP